MDGQQIDRRTFLERGGKAAGFAAAALVGGALLHEPERHPFRALDDASIRRDLRIPDLAPMLVVARAADAAGSGTPARLTAAALEALGGISTFVSRGDFVVIKPNVGWDRRPEQAANTNPDVVAEVVRQCRAAGAARILVTDITCNDATRCFHRSGIAAAAREAGAEVQLAQEARFRDVNIGGAMLGRQSVYDAYLEADKFINLPIAKHHSLTRVTLGMKNLYGILGGNRSRLHQDIHNSLADLAHFVRPTLVLLDAWRVLLRNGPQGGSLADVEERRMLVAGTDPVALDAFGGAEFFGLTVEEMPWIGLAEARGLGTSDHASLRREEITI
ncbi:MAG: DUF362 domain-containing protein [Bacteroidota bacterium]|jgi:uncharacterized protein (DUF362 family)|nr:DUF362 domain-containing protein [Bacteroidota bacterium]